MAVTAKKNISVNGIKDVVETVGVICSIIFRMETQTQEFIVNFLLIGKTSIINIWLNQNSTNITIAVLGKANHSISTIREIDIMRFDTFEKRSEIVV